MQVGLLVCIHLYSSVHHTFSILIRTITQPYLPLTRQGRVCMPFTASTTGYHTYAVEWAPWGQMQFFVDDILVCNINSWWSGAAALPAPFDQPFYLVLNLAVGGAWQVPQLTRACTCGLPNETLRSCKPLPCCYKSLA